jgi:DNA-binding LacI/PurR family transcriptional regulator
MSITQIAKEANVSYATAWRIINNRPCRSPEAVRAVKEAMTRIGYAPENVRRGRRPKAADGIRTHNIALLHLRQGSAVSTSILAFVQRMLAEKNLNLIFAHVESPSQLPQALRAGNIDGILGYGEYPAEAITPQIRQVPAVWMMSRNDVSSSDAWGDRVRPDHHEIGRLAAQYLLDRGHRHLAFFNPNPSQSFYTERGVAFRAAAETGLIAVGQKQTAVPALNADPLPPAEQNSIAAMEAAAEQFVEQWLASDPRPTGAFIPVDRVALRVYRHLEQHKIQPGRDIDIVSCDNEVELLSLMDPPPASIDLNRKSIARLAVERLLWRMRHRMASPAITISVSPVLISKSPESPPATPEDERRLTHA